MPLTELMPERYRDAHRAGMARFLATGEPRVIGSTLELEGLRADGREFPLELSLGTWSRGGAVCFSAVVRDLTDRVRARRALREAEERFAGAFEGAAVGMLLAAPDGTLLRANRALCELTGKAGGRPARPCAWTSSCTPTSAAPTSRRSARCSPAARSASPRERRLLAADGATRIARINLSLIRDTDGTPLHFVGQVEDVTERRRMLEALTLSEARYKGLIVAPAGLDGAPVRPRPAAPALRGRPDARARLRPGAARRPAARGGPARPTRSRGSRPSTAPRWPASAAPSTATRATARATYWVQIAPLRDEVGRVIGGMALSRDITERRRPSARSRTARASSSAPTRSSSSSPTSPRTTSPSRCAWSPATCSSCAAATTAGSTATPTRSSTTPSTARARMRDLIDDLLTYSRAGRGDRPLAPVETARRRGAGGRRPAGAARRPARCASLSAICPRCSATSSSSASCSRT